MKNINPNDISEEQAINLCKGDYGKETLKQIAHFAAPIFWEYRGVKGDLRQNNGSIFFVNAGKGIFAVTAKHVFDGYLEKFNKSIITDFGIIPDNYRSPGREIINIPIHERLIDDDPDLDIATFSVTESEMEEIGSHVITAWPPKTPELGFGIGLVGYPGHERTIQGFKEICFSPFPVLGVPDDITDRFITIQFDEEFVVETPGFYTAPPGYETPGMSGGPLLTHCVTKGGISFWRLGGVITKDVKQYGILIASRIDHLNKDGTFARNRKK